MQTTRLLILPALLLAAPLFTPFPSLAGSKTPPPASTTGSAARRVAIVDFCRKNRGQKVGNGECWTLADEAFKQTGARRPGSDLRVWGRLLNLKRESPASGDILECLQTRFSDGSYVPGKHTAVIIGVQSPSIVRIAEQNFSGKKKVTERELDLNSVQSGSIFIYRP